VTRSWNKAHKRRRASDRPVWSPLPLDVTWDKIKPRQPWIMLKEIPLDDEYTTKNGMVLSIARPGVRNTVYGEILASSKDADQRIHVSVGDIVVYREWEGGRWNLSGEVVLITKEEHILGIVTS